MITRLFKQILLCLFLLVPLSLKAETYSKLVVFGDSLSDNGNLASVPSYSFLNQLPYKQGFNNGDPAVNQLAKLLGLSLMPSLHLGGGVFGNNFAVAGARASGNTGIDLTTQVAAFLASQAGKATKDTLYIIFIGGNDIRDMRDQADEKTANTVLGKATGNVKAALSQLLNAGASHFMVVNSPDIGKIPETAALAAAGKYGLVRRASQKTLAFNKKLKEAVGHIEKSKGVDIVLFDLLTFFNGITGNGKAYHFNNTTNACFSSVTFLFYPVCNAGKLDSFAFFDEIHPTQRVHERLGRALFAAIPEAN